MKKKLWQLSLTSIFLISLFLQSVAYVHSADTATLTFDPESQEASVNDTVSVDTIVNGGSEEYYSVDAFIEYDSTMLEYVSVQDGDFFPLVFNEDISPGRLYIGAAVSEPTVTKTGTGTFAAVSFKALKQGTTTISYYCDKNDNQTSTVVSGINVENIINCSGNGTAEIIIAEGGEPTVGPEATNTPTPTETSSTDDESSSNDGTGGTDTVGTDNVTELPQSGILDNILQISIPGFALLLIGAALKLLL